ncbi:MAG: DUF488 domain-containing protein [Rhodobacteraceae bacterium]|nr:DUF488 domain-containing protein [Gammaproteobacteria bacterium]MCY4327549.1 DUF488 domain-containing protein [Paracoccaceae bacterium]
MNARSVSHHQRLLISLVASVGGRLEDADLQSLVFLYGLEAAGRGTVAKPAYYFVPLGSGAYSYSCAQDCHRMERHGLVEQRQTEWHLTQSGRELAVAHAAEFDPSIFSGFSHLRGEPLKMEVERRAICIDAASHASQGGAKLMTIGYEGKSLEEYLNQLLSSSVSMLVDVRRNAISRKFGFSKRALSSACGDVGIGYEHLPELGIDSANRRQIVSQDDRDALFSDYEATILVRESAAITGIRDMVLTGRRVALTCFERHATQCHRHRVAAQVAKASREILGEAESDRRNHPFDVVNL